MKVGSPVSVKPTVDAPDGWRWTPLQEVARLESGHTPSRRHPEYWGGDIPWLSLKDIQGLHAAYVHETQDMPTSLGIENSSARVLPKGTVALCRTASVGKVAILGCDMATSQDFVNWVCGPSIHPEYLYWALRASAATFELEKQGSTHKTIYMPVLERLQVLLPPVEEQRRIAAILDKADAIRRKRREALELTGLLLRSTFLAMFGDPVSNPKGWPRKPLSEVSEIGSGIMKGRVYEGVRLLSVPYMRVANVQDGHVNLDDVKEIEFPASELEKYRLKAGDVLMTEGGDPDKLGRGALWNGEIEPCVHQNHVFRVRADGDMVNPVYLVALLGTAYAKRYFLRQAKQTTGIATINKTQISAFPTLCPPIALQSSYADISANVTTLHGRRAESAADAEALYQSLTHRAFTGQL